MPYASSVCQRHGVALDRAELIGTMKRLLACLVLCASLSASAQDTNCTVLGIQDLTQMVFQLQAEIDSLKGAGMTRDSVADIAVGVAYRGELSGANLAGVYLFDADLDSANFSGADLSGAELSYARLNYADLSGADLSGADLIYTNFYYANLIGANLSGANLTYASLRYANLIGANLSGANLTEAYLYDANLEQANLSGAQLTGTYLTGATMTCLQTGCPLSLPPGYICEPDPDCSEPDRYRIVAD